MKKKLINAVTGLFTEFSQVLKESGVEVIRTEELPDGVSLILGNHKKLSCEFRDLPEKSLYRYSVKIKCPDVPDFPGVSWNTLTIKEGSVFPGESVKDLYERLSTAVSSIITAQIVGSNWKYQPTESTSDKPVHVFPDTRSVVTGYTRLGLDWITVTTVFDPDSFQVTGSYAILVNKKGECIDTSGKVIGKSVGDVSDYIYGKLK